MNTSDSGCAHYTPQPLEKLGWRLFPKQHIDPPEMVGAHDVFHCHTVASFSFMDRLRILFSGEIKITTKTATENLIGNHATATGVEILPPKILRRKD